jgi:alpha-1,2-mannosyltransferase
VAATRLRLSTVATAAAVALIALATAVVAWRYLLRFPNEPMVDLEVYQRAGAAVRHGDPLYEDLDSRLVFTYPPFAALVAVAATPVTGWLGRFTWTLATVAALVGVVVIAFRPLLQRWSVPTRRLAIGVLASVALLSHPMVEHVFYGQVNVVLVLLCTVDVLVAPGRRWRGALVGVAAALKLTPGVFAVYLWITGRRRPALIAVGVAAACTVLAAAVLPDASVDFWTREIYEGQRVAGSITYTSNQSLLGLVGRAVPGAVGTVLWLAAAAVVAAIGFTRARRAFLAGDERGGVALTALLAVLLSPVAWIHHFVWLVPVLGALVADGRSRARVAAAIAVTFLLMLRLPWWGWSLLDEGPLFGVVGVLAHNAYALLALALLLLYPIPIRRPGDDSVAGATESLPSSAG